MKATSEVSHWETPSARSLTAAGFPAPTTASHRGVPPSSLQAPSSATSSTAPSVRVEARAPMGSWLAGIA